jgi:excisionase family DNA binding protein
MEQIPARPLTVREFAHWAQVTPWTVRQWCQKGKVKAHKVGHDWRIDRSELAPFLPEPRRRSLFDALNVEFDPGICDKLPLLEGFSTENVIARRTGA